jgi:glycosyltransferase involved in cell wall biosynthesis
MSTISHPDHADCATGQAAKLVSVIIPAYNAQDTVVRAIDSVLAQQDVALELIVVDDGSADATVDIVGQRLRGEPRARLLRMAANGGVSAARNFGIRAANGAFLAFLDADDIWLPGKLSKQLARIAHDPQVTLVSCNSRLVGPGGQALKEGHRNRPPVEGADAWKTLLQYNFIPTPTVLTRTALVRECGGFDETLAVGEDLDLWIKLGTRGAIAVLPDILINYSDMAGSLMKRHSGRAGAIVTPMLERHIEQQRARLSAAEIRLLRGRQAFQMGCDLYFSGHYDSCVPLFLKAVTHGERPLKSLSYIPRALLMQCWRARPAPRPRAGGRGKRPG